MKKQQKDFSYYQLKLKEHIEASFPEKSADSKLIDQRAKWAANAYESAFRSGNAIYKCDEIADYILYEGLHFSKFTTLFEVLTYEFTDLLFDFEFRDFAIKILPHCSEVFDKYELTDDFAYTNDYDLLYTELTGFIGIWIEENGIQ